MVGAAIKPTRAEIDALTGGNRRMTRAFELLFESLNDTSQTVAGQTLDFSNALAAQTEVIGQQDAALQSLSDRVGAQSSDISSLEGGVADLEAKPTPLLPITARIDGPLVGVGDDWQRGVVIPVACRLKAVTFYAETAGASAEMNTMRNTGVAYTSTHNTQSSTSGPIAAVDFAAGDLVSFRTNVLNGAWADCRICAWFEVI